MRVRMSGTATVSANVRGGVCLATTGLVMHGRSSVVRNRGGGILAYDAADWRVGKRHRVAIKMSDAASVSRNSSARGAGIYLEWTGAGCASCTDTPPRMVLQDRASVTKNTARDTGGGIYVKGGRVVLRNHAAVVRNRPNNIVIRHKA